MIGYLVVETSYCSDELALKSIQNMRTYRFFRSLAVDGATLYLFKNSQSNNYLYEDTQFLLAATGTLIYHDRRGNEALKRLAVALLPGADIASEYLNFRGPYTLLVLQKARNRLDIVTDKGGLQHSFISTQDGAFALSSSLLLLASISQSSLDATSVREFIHLGACMQRRTLFKNIERMASATALTRDQGLWRSQRLWKIRVESPHLPDRYSEIVEKSCKMLEAATRVAEAIEPGRVVADLTAGTDSRTVLSFLLRAHPQLTVSAAGAADHIDVTRSKKIASKLGLPHYWNEQREPPALTSRTIDRCLELADGSLNPFDISRRLEYFDQMTHRFDMSFGGNGGPLFKDHYWLFEFNRTGLNREPNWKRIAQLSIITYAPQEDFIVGFDRPILSSVEDILLAHSSEVVGTNNQKLDYVYFDLKCPAMTGSVLSLCNKFYDVYHPLLEGDTVQYVINVDPSVRKHNILQFSMIYRNNRRLAWIPTDTGIPAVPPLGRFVIFRPLVLRRYARSAFRKLNTFVLKRNSEVAAGSAVSVANSLWTAGYMDFLDYPRMAIAPIISRKRLSAMCNRPNEGSNQTYLMNTLAVELFVKRVEELGGRRIERF